MKSSDIVIIGNGVLGLSIAYCLSKIDKKTKITIIGPNSCDGSASIAAGAMINCFAEITSQTFSSSYSKEKFEISYQALKSWDKWIEELNSDLNEKDKLKLNYGTYVILNAEGGKLDSDNYEAMKKTLIEYDENFEEINDSDNIPAINPVPNQRPLSSIYLPNEACLDSNQYHQSLVAILKRMSNIVFIDNCAKKINKNASDAYSITLSTDEIINSDQVILANGSSLNNLIDNIPELKNKIPLVLSGVGYSILLSQIQLSPIENIIRTPNRSGACGLHALPRNDSLYIGATNNLSLSPATKPKAGLFDFLLNCALKQINQDLYNSTIEGFHVGNRPVSFDTFPLIGETSLKGLWIINGTYRDGLHQSPVIAKHIANLIHNKEGIIKTNSFLPERKLIRTATKEESIEQFIYHYMAGVYEHSAILPKFMTTRNLENMLHTKAEHLYNLLETDYSLSPEMLIMIEFSEQQKELISFLKQYLMIANQ